MTDHDHDWGDAAAAPIGTVRQCHADGCTEWAVRHPRRVRWEPPTSTEHFAIVCRMIEDLVIHDTMVLIHGPDVGPIKARLVLGYATAEDRRRLGYTDG